MGSKDARPASKGLRTLGRPLHLLASIALLFGLAYLLGHGLLSGPLTGRETGFHLAHAEWLNDYFPTFPNWYPYEGGGISLTHGGSILSYLLVVLTSRISGLSIVQAFRLIGFLSLPLTALGIYFLAWSITRKQTVGLLAGVFYLLTPATWAWHQDLGEFPQGVAMVFLPYSLMCFDRYLSHHLARSRSGSRRLWLVGVIVSLALAALAEPGLAGGTGVVILSYGLLRTYLARRTNQATSLVRFAFATLAMAVIALLLLAGYLVPLGRYLQVAAREAPGQSGAYPISLPPVGQFLGLAPLDPDQAVARLQVPLAVTLFFIVGTLFARFYSRKALALCLPGALGLVFILLGQPSPPPAAGPAVSQPAGGPPIWLPPLMILLPLGAAFGAWAMAWTVVHPKGLLRRAHLQPIRKRFPGLSLRGEAAAGLALLLAAGALLRMGALASPKPGNLAYGPLSEGIGLGNIWNRTEAAAGQGLLDQLALENWPRPTIRDEGPPAHAAAELAPLLPQTQDLRIDVSPHLPTLAGGLAALSPASQIHLHDPRLSLIGAGWAYQRNVFYSRELGVDEFGNPKSLNSVAQWFGTQYVLLDPRLDRPELYEAAGWRPLHQEDGFQLWRYPAALEMASLTTRPTILVTEKPSREVFSTIFRLSNDGLLPYEEALLVEGRERIDRYALEDLGRFDALLLVGYDYRNSSKAWQTLADYVRQGGSLFVDTGWQFAVAEWEFDQAPAVLPVARLSWTDYGMARQYELGPEEIAGDVDVGQFKPLIWEDQPWALSGAEAADVRDWAQVVLSAGGRPLIAAGEYGQGRVVWSGMNLIGHSLYLGRNEEQLRLLRNLMGWLIEGQGDTTLASAVVVREQPDRVEFALEAAPGELTWLYWREATHPNWHAYQTDSAGTREIPIYRGGPGFMLMPVETSAQNASVTLVWQPALAEKAGLLLSFLGVGLLAALTLDGLVLGGSAFTWIKIAVTMRLPGPFLGEGSNLEWAERKRAEIAAQRAGHPSKKKAGAPPLSDLPDWELNDQAEQPSQDDGREIPVEVSPDLTPTVEEGEKLMQSWLAESSHPENEWAERVLRRTRRAR